MESVNDSDEEAPPHNKKKKDLTKSQWLEAISIVRMKSTEDYFQRGALMDVTKRLNVAHSMMYRLWKWAVHMHATGIINTPELVSWGKFQESA